MTPAEMEADFLAKPNPLAIQIILLSVAMVLAAVWWSLV